VLRSRPRGRNLGNRHQREHRYVRGQLRRSKKQISIRGLNKEHNHDLKGLFKAAATRASVPPGPFQEFYQRSLAIELLGLFLCPRRSPVSSERAA
jgi:hypothetical protein